jgi:uncharacterized repeat protein (TIGR03803 family)
MLLSASSFFRKFCLLALALAESIFFASPELSARETILHNFTGNSAGAYPFSNLIFDPLGNLYGESNGDGSFEGNVYELSPDGAGGWKYTEIYEFGFDGLGAYPIGPLTMDDRGNLYGVTLAGGTNNTGTVYTLSQLDGSWSITYLYSFGPMLSADGAAPNGVTYFRGALFGTTSIGGKNGSGTAFAVWRNPDGGWSETILHDFAVSNNDGQRPSGGVALDSKGNIYGTTMLGGPHQGGIVFELSREANGGWHEQILHGFLSRDGYQPGAATPVFDGQGNLYSTTTGGGSSGDGVVFELTPSGGEWTETILHNFTGGKDGSSPDAGVVLDSHGRLFGTTPWGGGNGYCWTENDQNLDCGTVYMLSPSDSGPWKESILQRFSDGSDGGFLDAGIVLDGQDNVYGVATHGGPSDLGVAFEISNAPAH